MRCDVTKRTCVYVDSVGRRRRRRRRVSIIGDERRRRRWLHVNLGPSPTIAGLVLLVVRLSPEELEVVQRPAEGVRLRGARAPHDEVAGTGGARVAAAADVEVLGRAGRLAVDAGRQGRQQDRDEGHQVAEPPGSTSPRRPLDNGRRRRSRHRSPALSLRRTTSGSDRRRHRRRRQHATSLLRRQRGTKHDTRRIFLDKSRFLYTTGLSR